MVFTQTQVTKKTLTMMLRENPLLHHLTPTKTQPSKLRCAQPTSGQDVHSMSPVSIVIHHAVGHGYPQGSAHIRKNAATTIRHYVTTASGSKSALMKSKLKVRKATFFVTHMALQ